MCFAVKESTLSPVSRPEFVPPSLPPRMFGCTCFVHNLTPGKDKLQHKAFKCVFLGYSRLQKENQKAMSAVLPIPTFPPAAPPPSLKILDDDGLAAPGEIIRPHDIYINKESPTITRTGVWAYLELEDSPSKKQSRQTYEGPEGGTAVVDRVALYSDSHKNLCIKLMIRHTRRPEIGDKFSCRHGHKGVCGLIVQQEDFPFSECGICPDLIINPHGFPDRMTVGKMKELLGSKAGVVKGRFHDGTAFSKASGHVDTVEAISKTLVTSGYSYNGKDFLYSGTHGTPIQTYIFTGPIYYQKLKHMVMDKMQAHATARRDIVTRQLTEGIRVGEMERDSLISYGASLLINERLMISSDPFEAQVCRKCGLLGYYNYELQIGICSMCKNGENISTVKMPYAFKLLIQELQSMNIVLRLKLAED